MPHEKKMRETSYVCTAHVHTYQENNKKYRANTVLCLARAAKEMCTSHMHPAFLKPMLYNYVNQEDASGIGCMKTKIKLGKMLVMVFSCNIVNSINVPLSLETPE